MPTTAVVFSMGDRGHFNRLLPVIDGLVRAGVTTWVFTDRAFRDDVRRAGGQFSDLFASHSVAEADTTSLPLPCRYVSFAGLFSDAVVDAVTPLNPSLIVHDTFAVIGYVVANRLGLPRVNVCSGHNLAPGPAIAEIHRDRRIEIDQACRDAVDLLRTRDGIVDASPFLYMTGISPLLNLYCEPPEFLRTDEREAFAPISFFGSLWPAGMPSTGTASGMFRSGAGLRVYVSFGTVIWRYYRAEAIAALDALVAAIGERNDAEAVISLGGTAASLSVTAPNVRVERYVDQWQILQTASVYVTHQGLNSTHEAIFHGVPMVSYPFFGDQPGLAARCQELGLAVPLVGATRGPVSPRDVHTALDRVAANRATLSARLDVAREWELDTIRARPDVIARMTALAIGT